MLSRIESILIPKLELSALQKRLEIHFVKPFKGLYDDLKRKTLVKPIWVWDDNIIPLSEDMLIEKENSSISEEVGSWIKSKEQYRKKIEQSDIALASKTKTESHSKNLKSEKEHVQFNEQPTSVVDSVRRKYKNDKGSNGVDQSDAEEQASKFLFISYYRCI